MGALGDYIHLQKLGYMGKNPNNQNTIHSEGQSVYNAVNKVQNDIINNYNTESINKQIKKYQDILNIYTGFTQRNNLISSDDEKKIASAAAKKMLKTVKTILKEEYPDYAKAYITKTYDAKKNKLFEQQEVQGIKNLLQQESYLPKNNTDVLNILLSKLKYINKCYERLIAEKKEEKIDKSTIDKYISIIDALINSSLLTSNESKEEGIIIKQINITLKDLIKSINIEELEKAINDKNIEYEKIQKKFLNIKVRIDSETLETSLPEIIQALIKLTRTGINLKRVKGDALEYMLAVAAEVGDPRNMAESALEEAFKNASKKNISNRVIGTTGVSNTIVNFNFIDKKYRKKIKEQMKFQTPKGNILVTNTGVQEKIDVYVNLGKGLENIGVTAKNYSFDKSSGEQIVYGGDKGISMITDSPLLSFLQDDTNSTKTGIMGEFSNHLLNLKIQHPLMPNGEVTSNMLQHNILIKEYSALLNKIILIKSIIGEGMLRANGKRLKTINGAHLFVLNNNQTGQIVVKSTGQLVDYCLKNNNGIYSVLYNSSYDDPLQELQYIKQDFKTPNDRIADIIMKLYNIKVTVKLNINFNKFAELDLTK